MASIRTAIASAAVLATLLPLLGCQAMVNLPRDLETIRKTAIVSGTVRTQADPSQVVVVATASPPASDGGTGIAPDGEYPLQVREVVTFSRLSPTSVFALVVPADRRYWISAFADRNGNGRWDSEEEGSELGGSEGLAVTAGSTLELPEIELSERPSRGGLTKKDRPRAAAVLSRGWTSPPG